MPGGPIVADAPQVIPPPKPKVMRDMESLIHHFIIFTQGFKPPKGETTPPDAARKQPKKDSNIKGAGATAKD